MDYSKYKFNYFDVIKRHERIINRPKDWEVKVLAIIMLMITFIYTFTNFGFCAQEEPVNLTRVDNLNCLSSSNYFTSSTNFNQFYCELEKGYIYHIYNNNTNYAVFCFCNDIPALNVTYYDRNEIDGNSNYSFIVNDNNTYLYLSCSNFSENSNRYVTREKIASYEGAVTDLVDNVGVNQIWSVFENGTSFIGVVVLVALGLFLVVLAIKKVSKGKSEF